MIESREIEAGSIKAAPMDLSEIAYDEASGLFYPVNRPDLLPYFAARRDLQQAELDRVTNPWWLRWLRSVRWPWGERTD